MATQYLHKNITINFCELKQNSTARHLLATQKGFKAKHRTFPESRGKCVQKLLRFGSLVVKSISPIH